MFILLISIITLLSATPAFAMLATKTSRLQQRAYATMAKKDFERLTELQENNYPLHPRIFDSELAVMKKDDEDLENLREHLSLQVNFLKKEHDEYMNNKVIGLPLGIIFMFFGLGCYCDDILVLSVPFFTLAVTSICTSLSGIKKNYSKHKAFSRYKKNLEHINALLEPKKDQQACLQHEAALKKIKDRYRE